jgi:DNA-binding SARP family transcriptional activator
LEVRLESGAVASLGGPRQRALLALLALHANQVVSTDALVDQLWHEPPPAAVHTIHVFVSRLRRALGPAGDRLVTRPPGYVVELADDELDATCGERLYARGRVALAAGDPELAARLLRDAEALWRGPALSDFTYEPFAQAVIARLQELWVSCREDRLEAELELGLHARLVSELEELVQNHPLRERLWGQLMLALYRSDRQGEALEAFQEARRMLVGELGVEPGVGLRTLQEAILRQDDALRSRPAALPPAPRVVGDSEPVEPGTDPQIARKTVTVLVATLGGRGPPGRADPEMTRRLIELGRQEAARIVARHGGRFHPGLGGEFIGVFGLSLAREDDALRALRAADELRERVMTLMDGEPGELGIRLGLDTGEVVAETVGQQLSLFGEPLERGGALARMAQDGQTLLSDATRRLAPDAIRARRVEAAAWRLDAIIPNAPAVRRRDDVPMVGRDKELMDGLAAFDRATRTRSAQLLTVIGDPGLGKSRLGQELARRLSGRATAAIAQCGAYGQGTSLWPLREVVTHLARGNSREAIRGRLGAAEDADAVADLVFAALGLSDQVADQERIPWAFRRLFEALAERDPLVLIVEDAQSAEPPLLDLLEYLVEWLTTPVLVLCLARPELRDARPHWSGGRVGVTSLVLEPLQDEDATRLLESLIGERSLSPAERDEVLRAAEGNPLFIEQLLAMRSEDGGWALEPRIPATIQAILAARIDRLGPGERALIERAAVIGRQFSTSAAIELLPTGARPAAQHHLRELVHRDLISPDRSTPPGEETLRFRHILIRDVAYRACPKSVRSSLHQEFAAWLTQRAENNDEVVGYHLEQAFAYRRELERLNADALALATRAGGLLAAAGQRALGRGDVSAASHLLRRSANLFEAAGAVRPDVLLALGRALSDSWDSPAAGLVLQAALDAAREAHTETLVARTRIALSNQRVLLEPHADLDERLKIAEAAIEVFVRSGDETGLAQAWRHIGLLHWIRCRYADMENALGRALMHAERAGDTRERSEILSGLMRAIVFGPCPVDVGIRRCHALEETASEDVVLATLTDFLLAVLEAMRTRIDVARGLCRGARQRLEEMGLYLRVAGLEIYAAMVELIAGDPRLADPGLERAYETLSRGGERSRVSTLAAFIARTRYAQGSLDEALHFTCLCEELTSPHDVASQILWRGTRARVLARVGDGGREAATLANTGVELAGRTDSVYLQAEALTDLADVRMALDQPDAAVRALDEAIALHDAKQNEASSRAARTARGLLLRQRGALTPPRPTDRNLNRRVNQRLKEHR